MKKEKFVWNEHKDLELEHAFLSPSQSSWIDWDDNTTIQRFDNRLAAMRGTADHEFAKLCIDRGDKLAKNKQSLHMHVNDAIGFRMRAEQKLVYVRDIAHGTADAISFNDGVLRIHDLKTGVIPGKMRQLDVYVALFCLEYRIDPRDIKVETRIYQNGDIVIEQPNAEYIRDIMEIVIHKADLIAKRKREIEMDY